MKLQEIYAKDINRNIQGVIKVDDDRDKSIKQELEEYVVTGEIEKHFNEFFDAYTTSIGVGSRTEKMGVWISGFFGSGKSHFLKILAYLLENREIDGKNAIDYFNDKITDKMLVGNITRSGKTPSDVILFNIDAKSSLESTTQKDRILKVFEKVFNDKLGYSQVNYVADIEQYIEEKGKLDEFKAQFEEGWENVRDNFDFEEDRIAEVYAKVMNASVEDAKRLFSSRRDHHEVSAESFAERIQKYIESKGNDHHVVFLVDEVGQYIGDNGELLLSLQSVVEELGVRTGGKAWVVCTSQEAIDDVMHNVKRNDFSKILGRFDTKIKLASTDIEEVIKMRLLEKTEEASETLKQLYRDNDADIRNAFSFSAGTQTQSIYTDADNFAATYPYVPYQFSLVQNTYGYIREKGFAGAHLSSGARSLLSAVQETAKAYQNDEIGRLVPFSAFYETIKTAVDSSVTRIFERAEEIVRSGNLENFDIAILKTLFMLRGAKEIPSTVENLATLEITQIGQDRLELEKNIRDSLKRLEDQTYVQKTNETYAFLTDEEQEVNKAIQKITVDQNKINDQIGDILRIFGSKYTYSSRRIFSVDLYIEDHKLNAGAGDLTLVFTLDNESAATRSTINTDRAYVVIELSPDMRDDVRRAIQIDEYMRMNAGVSKTVELDNILAARTKESSNIKQKIDAEIKTLIETAPVYIGGAKMEISARDAKLRIEDILKMLTETIYTKIHYIEAKKTVADAKQLLNNPKDELAIKVNQKAADEIIEELTEQAHNHMPSVSLSSLISKFKKQPWGFDEDDIAYLIASLLKDERISVQKSSNTLDNSEAAIALGLSREYDRVSVKIREKIDTEYVESVKTILKDAFGLTVTETGEDAIMAKFRNSVEDCERTISTLLSNYNDGERYPYPGKVKLVAADEILRSLVQIKDNAELFAVANGKRDDIIGAVNGIEKVCSFFENQRPRFDAAKDVIKSYETESMYHTIENTESDEIIRILTMAEPYGDIASLSTLTANLKSKIEAKTEERRKREEERRKREEEERRKREEEAKQNGGDAPVINTPKKKMVRSGDLIKKSYILKNEEDINLMLEEFKKELLESLKDNDEVEVM